MNEQDTRFQDYLERLAAGEPLDGLLREIEALPDAGDLAASLSLAARMQDLLPLRMPAARRARMQAELQRAFEGPEPRRGPGTAAWLRQRLLLRLSALAAAVLLALGGVVGVSANSLPGQILYPIKLAAEQGRLALAMSDAARIQIRLDITAERMAELGRLAESGANISMDQVEALVRSEQSLFEDARAAGDPALMRAAQAQAAANRSEIAALRESLSGAPRGTIEDAARSLEAIEAERRPEPSPRPEATVGGLPAGPDGAAQPGAIAAPSMTPLPAAIASPRSAGSEGPAATAADPALPTPRALRSATAAVRPVMPVEATLLPPATLVPLDPAATARTRAQERQATRAAREADATARARAMRATMEAVRATEGPAAARATIQARRERERAARATADARATERASRPAPRQTSGPIVPTPSPESPAPTEEVVPPTPEAASPTETPIGPRPRRRP